MSASCRVAEARSTNSAKRPARSIAPLSTSSSGSTPSNEPLSVLGHRHADAAAGRGPAARCRLSTRAELERLAMRSVEPPADPRLRRSNPASATGRRRRSRTAGGPASRSARSSTCEAVSALLARARAARPTTPSTGLVWRSERSASLTRRSIGRGRSSSAGLGVVVSAASPAPNVAWISGANVSMSGHITITSRGSSVGSSSSRGGGSRRGSPRPGGRGRGRRGPRSMRSSGSSSGRASGSPGSGGTGRLAVGA